MAAYLIVELDITDLETFEAYRKQVPATIEAYGGRYVIRGGAAETLEGDWDPARIVVLEFPDMTTLKAWYGSEMYAGPKALRLGASKARMIAVEGVDA